MGRCSMTTHLATSEQQARVCELCLRERARLPGLFCDACAEYLSECEAERGAL